MSFKFNIPKCIYIIFGNVDDDILNTSMYILI